MKRTSILAALLLALFFSQLGCGGPAIGDLKTLQISAGSTNLVGEGGTLQLSVVGRYSSGDTKDLSNAVTYVVTPQGTDANGTALAAPPQTITVSTTGLVTAVAPFVCTWVDVGTSTTASWALSGSYQIVGTFHGISSQPIFISVAAAVGSNSGGNNPNLACGPTT